MQATSGVASLERSAPSDADLQDPETLRGCHTALVIAVDGATIGGDIAAMTAKEGQARLPEPGRLVGAVVGALLTAAQCVRRCEECSGHVCAGALDRRPSGVRRQVGRCPSRQDRDLARALL